MWLFIVSAAMGAYEQGLCEVLCSLALMVISVALLKNLLVENVDQNAAPREARPAFRVPEKLHGLVFHERRLGGVLHSIVDDCIITEASVERSDGARGAEGVWMPANPRKLGFVEPEMDK